jgi:hypothetical protein
MAYAGQCLCGAVKLTISAEPVGARTCMCRTCQKFSGGIGTTNAFFPVDAVQPEGELTWFENVADSGNVTNRAFCPKCGSHVFTKGSGAPHICGVRVSILDNSNAFPPQSVIWTESALEWAVIDPKLPHHPKAPPVPSPKAD